MKQRKPDLQIQIDRLQQKHIALDARTADLNRQHILSEQDRFLVNSLKKEKLATKDALMALQRMR